MYPTRVEVLLIEKSYSYFIVYTRGISSMMIKGDDIIKGRIVVILVEVAEIIYFS